MKFSMIATLIILVLTSALLVWGKIRSDIIAICSMLALVLTGVITPEEGLAGFSNSVVIMIAGLFIIGGAITQTGIATKISNKTLALAGGSPNKLSMMVMLVTVVVGLFVSNTGTAAILMPIVISLANQSNTNPSRLLMPMAFMCSISGMMTLIGTPPTLIVHGVLMKAGYEGLGFFTTLPVGLIILVLGMVMLIPMSKLLEKGEKGQSNGGKSRVKSQHQLSYEYKIVDNLYRLDIAKDSPLIGKTLKELAITQRYSCTIAEIRTRHHTAFGRNVVANLPEGDTEIGLNDLLYVLGEFDDIKRFAEENRLKFFDATSELAVTPPKFSGKFKFNQFGLAEVVLLRGSRLNDKLVRDTHLRNMYNVNILAVQRNDNYLLQDISNTKLLSGDMLLVQGTWEDIAKMSQMESDIVVIGQPEDEASKITLDHKGTFASIVILLMILSMVFNWLPPVVSVLIATVLVILGGCFRSAKDAYNTINWDSVVLFACMMPLATAMENTGLSSLISDGLVHSLGSMGPYAVLAGILLGTSILTMFISNTATAILFAPIAIAAAQMLEVNPMPFLIGVTVAASMCFASPFSTPPNAMVMSVGKYSFKDYIKVGLPLQVVILIVMVVALPLIYPF
ncbi:hypothetical protein IX339_001082 [Porphyromonas levii]|nr:hypothetical protein [Porphyromonas levii]MBR8763214.1 hypothetical protein [Porphyromonas levii]MBR8765746.1 hypothetical protein [Porphyromonas levii]MBR8801847.1 hypothetical protein [Porphyromonas levii]